MWMSSRNIWEIVVVQTGYVKDNNGQFDNLSQGVQSIEEPDLNKC